jgi:AcrR family transcriptional regulator
MARNADAPTATRAGQRNAPATKDRILEAAFEEFTEKGFSGARVDDIAARAGCNKALLYQHYGDKERLFEHVLESKMHALWEDDPDPANVLDEAAKFFDFHAANPWVARLLQWEALNFGGAPVPNEATRKQHLARHVEQLRRAQQLGTVDPSLDPEQTLVTLAGLIGIWFMSPQLARMVTGEDPRTPKALKRRRAHVLQIAQRILEVKR